MKFLVVIFATTLAFLNGYALEISEIMSNPVGDDAGREWVEVHNESEVPVDVATLSLSIKGGSFISAVPIQGGTIIPPKGYAVVSSIVSASSPISRFLDSGTGYPDYAGILLRSASSIAFVNTGTTTLDVRLSGSVIDSLSYSPAGEGKTLSKIGGVFVSGKPTPGFENQLADTSSTIESFSNSSQATIAQTSPPLPDIILLLPGEKLVVAGAESLFSVHGMTKSGQPIQDLSGTWSFGDGGQSTGTTTTYAYAYPGHYVARVDVGNSSIRGVGTMRVKVVTPELVIKGYGVGKYGAYVDLENPNDYDLDISQWRISLGFSQYSFPANTILASRSITRISGKAMGFEKHVFREGDIIRITFPNLEEIASISIHPEIKNASDTPKTVAVLPAKSRIVPASAKAEKASLLSNATPSKPITSAVKSSRDTRLAIWIKSFFAK